jgi:gliding motility-associated-like protein/uncharacterized repeat protein (TIGR01451 family)
MKHLCRIIVICGLLIITSKGYSQKPGIPPLPTYTISAGTTIVLHGASTGAAAYQWYLNDVAIPGATGKDYTTEKAGTYAVVTYNIEGCASQLSDAVVVIITTSAPPSQPDTLVDLTIGIQSSNTQVQPGQSYTYIITANNNSQPTGTQVTVTYVLPPQISYAPEPISNGNVSYNPVTRTLTWDIGMLVQNKPVTLVVPVTVLEPGAIQSTVDIKGKQPDPVLFNNVAEIVQQVNPLIIPNVFTPNGDGINDTFLIPGLNTYTENEITIINRWGNDVYEKKNYQNDWTGNGLVEGTYFYVLKVLTLAGNWDVYKGYVTLLRTKKE